MVRNVDGGIQSVPIVTGQQVVQRTLAALELRLDEIIASKPETIDFILSNVQIIDSTGLNWLLTIQSRLETLGIRMRLVDPSAIICDVLLATRMDARFTIEVTAAGTVNGDNGTATGGTHGR